MSVTDLVLQSMQPEFAKLKLTLCVTKLDDDRTADSWDCYLTDFYQINDKGKVVAEARSIEVALKTEDIPEGDNEPGVWGLTGPYAVAYGDEDEEGGEQKLEFQSIVWYSQGMNGEPMGMAIANWNKVQDVIFATPNWR